MAATVLRYELGQEAVARTFGHSAMNPHAVNVLLDLRKTLRIFFECLREPLGVRCTKKPKTSVARRTSFS